MSIARPILPLQSAIAAWTLNGAPLALRACPPRGSNSRSGLPVALMRTGGAPDCKGRSGIMHATVPFPMYRGLTR